jgi:hypothetical protein
LFLLSASASSPLAGSSGKGESRVTEEGLEPIRKRWRSNWITETKRRSPSAAVSRTAKRLRLLPTRPSHDLQVIDRQVDDRQVNDLKIDDLEIDLQIVEPQKTLRWRAAGVKKRDA